MIITTNCNHGVFMMIIIIMMMIKVSSKFFRYLPNFANLLALTISGKCSKFLGKNLTGESIHRLINLSVIDQLLKCLLKTFAFILMMQLDFHIILL